MFLLKILLPLTATLMCLFPILSHPLSMGLTLLMITILGSTLMGVINSSLWISYAIILVLLGGLLVIFIYVALLASNELFIPNSKILFTSTTLLLTFMMLSTMFHYTDNQIQSSFNLNQDKLEWVSHLYSLELMNITIFLISYLLLTLIAVVYNTKNNSLSLRSSNQ